MTPRHMALVRSSWQQVQTLGPAAAALFYDKLFAAHPALRPMFRGDMGQQGQRLLGMLGAAVSLLERPEALTPVLRQLGQRHVGYGVRDEHYAMVGAALLDTLAAGLGDGFTTEVRAAWTEVYGFVSQTMMAAAAEMKQELLATI